jgi:protocatechuate 3,4-dioxygenase beta subunit
MAINSVGYGTSVLNQSVFDLKNQLTLLQSQLTTGTKSTSYAGMGVNEGFAIAARSQLANISAFTDAMSNINTNINIANTALQGMVDIGTTVLNSANSSMQSLNSAGQTVAQQTAASQFSSMLGILNMQAGDRYLFSGGAVNTPSVASTDNILNGTTTQAGLKQVISERQQADLGDGLGRLVVATPTANSVQVVEDAAGSPFGLKLNAVSSSLTGATVTGPVGSPPSVSISIGATSPNNGDKVSFAFKLPDGTTEQIDLTASSATPTPTGSFAIGLTPAATAGNLNTALTAAIRTLANTSLVAASAVEAGNEFFNSAATVTGSAVSNKASSPPAPPVTGATLLSGAANTDSLTANFAAGDTITVNGTAITFVASGATGNQLNVTDSVQTLLAKIDSVTGTSTPSTISDGVIALHADNGVGLTVKSSNSAAFAALGFGVIATQSPIVVAGSAVNNQASTPAPITGATALSGGPASDSLAASFAPGNTITVNGTVINFVNTGTTAPGVVPINIDVTDTVGTLLGKIDAITGTTIPSTVSGGAITLRSNAGSSLNITTTNSTAFAALGFSTPPSVTLPPLQVAGNAVNNQATTPAPIAGATLLSGAAGTNSLAASFAPGDTITVNGTVISFVNTGTTAPGVVPIKIDVTDTVGTLLGKIDAITGTTVASTVGPGGIVLRSDKTSSLKVTSSNSAAFAALGLGAAAPATVPPLRVAGSPLSTATTLVAGTPANTVTWYTGESGPGSARATATARVDQSVTVQYGARANETAIRSQLEALAVFAAVTTSPTSQYAAGQVAALSQRTAQNLATQPGQQTIQDIQTDFATAQMTMKNAGARQTQAKGMLQGIVDQAENVSPDQVASQILALQTSLQASYQTTAMLAQLTLTKFLPIA